MKKLYFLIIILFSTLLGSATLSSCGEDEDDKAEVIDVNQVIGTWMCTSSNDTFQGQTIKDLMIGKEVSLKTNGTYTSTSESFGYSGTWTLKGNEVTAKSSIGTFILTASINGNVMHWIGTSSNGVKFEYTFKKE